MGLDAIVTDLNENRCILAARTHLPVWSNIRLETPTWGGFRTGSDLFERRRKLSLNMISRKAVRLS